MTCGNEKIAGTTIARLSSATAQEQFATFEDLIEFSTNPASRLDQDNVLAATADTNTLVARHDLEPYTVLQDRISQGPLTSVEIAEFITQWGYTDEQLADLTRDIVSSTMTHPITGESLTGTTVRDTIPVSATTPEAAAYIKQLDQFYNENIPASISNNVCSIFATAAVVFGAIDTLSSANVDTLDELTNFDNLADILSLEALGESMKEIVDELGEKYVGQIENLAENAVEAINDLESSADRIFKAINKKAFELEEFFSEDKLDALKAKTESVIARMAGQFENLDAESVAFMMFRLCQYTQILDTYLSEPVDRMKALTDLTTSGFETIGVVQAAETVVAIAGGSWRATPDDRIARRANAINNISSKSSAGVTTPYVPAKLTTEEMQMIRSISSSGNDFFYFSESVLNMGITATNEHARTGINSYWSASENTSDAGWKYVAIHHPDIYVKLARISKTMGVRFKILSAYRSPWYNRVYQRQILGNTGAAFNSMHMSGMALDVAMRFNGVDYNVSHADFVRLASREGLGGIGIYSNFVHIDLGNRRTWNTSKSLTVEEKNVIQAHVNDNIRNGLV